MTTGRGYVSELRPPTGLLFIPKVIYEYVEPWWNDIYRGKSRFIHHSAVAILPAEAASSKSGVYGQRK
jgi:hypothetical protein